MIALKTRHKTKLRNFKTAYFACLFTVFFSSSINAQTNQDAINQQDWITRNQQNILEEKKRDKEFETIKKERERKVKEGKGENLKQKFKVLGKAGACFPIDEIHLLDANSLSKREQRKLTSPFLGKCFEEEVLSKLVTDVNQYYHDKGYITVQIKIPKQNVESGLFELQIIEGKIEEISFGKNATAEKMQEFTAFGNIEGEALNINDINQGIYQINRLQSNQAVMRIEPGTENGESKIVIDNNKKFPAHATIGRDNLGNKFTGIQRTSFSSSFDNLFSLNDNLSLSYATNLHDNSQTKELKSFSGGISIPFKYNTFSYDYSHSEFKGQNSASSTLTGFSDQRKFTIDHVFLNQASLRLSANTSLTAKNSATYLNGDKMSDSARRLSILNAGLTVSSYFNDTTSIYFNPSYSRGLKILDAKRDQANISNTDAKAQFDVFKLYANFSKKFHFPKTDVPMTLVSEMSGQYAKQTLFGSEQFSVGGYYSVRGFRENYINGDSGYYFRNKINFRLGDLVPMNWKIKKIDDNTAIGTKFLYLNNFTLEPFYDYGYVKNKYSDNGADGRLAGAGLKTIFSSKYFNASLTYSWATNHSRLVTSTAKENKMVLFEISASCC